MRLKLMFTRALVESILRYTHTGFLFTSRRFSAMPGTVMLHTADILPSLALDRSRPSGPQAPQTQRRSKVHHGPYRQLQLTVCAVHVL